MNRRALLISGAVSGWWMFAKAAEPEPVLGGPCEGCEWVFDSMPAQPSSTARIAPVDDTGIYPRAQNRHGRLRGWVRTDAEGRYRFDTIRPRAYPGRKIPEHMHVIERGGQGLAQPEGAWTGWRVRRDIVLGRNIPEYR